MSLFASHISMPRPFLLSILSVGMLLFCGCDNNSQPLPDGDTKTIVKRINEPAPDADADKSPLSEINSKSGTSATDNTVNGTPAEKPTPPKSPLVRISGKVTYDDGSPVSSGSVNMQTFVRGDYSQMDREKAGPAPIAKDGSYSIEGTDGQGVALTFTGPFVTMMVGVDGSNSLAPRRRKITKDVEVIRGVEVRGTVTDEKNQPVSGASVYLTSRAEERRGGFPSSAETSSTASGEIIFSNVRPGVTRFAATHPELANGTESAVVPTTTPLVIKMLRGGATLTGHVYRQETGAPVAGVKVSAIDRESWQPKSGESGPDGAFRIEHIAPGQASVVIRSSDPTVGAYPVEGSAMGTQVNLNDGQTSDVALFVYGGHTISGKVIDAETREPLAGAQIANSDGKSITKSDAEGNYRLKHVFAHAPRGLVQIYPSLDGYGVPEQNYGVRNGQVNVQVTIDELQVTHDITMMKTVAITGEVKTADGVPVPGAVVSLKRQHTSGNEKSVLSDSDGTYKLESRPFTEAAVKADAAGFATGYSESFPVGNQDVEGKDITLEVGAVVQGKVFSPDNQPVAGARVSVITYVWFRNSTSSDQHSETVSGTNGEFTLSNLPRNPRVQAFHEDYVNSDSEELTLKPGESRSALELHLKTAHSITGKVVDAAGAAVSNAYVRAKGPSETSDQSDENGAFEIKKISPGTYTVSVSNNAGKGHVDNVKSDTAGLVIRLSETKQEKGEEITLIGTVVDAATKEPIEDFNVGGNISGDFKRDPDRKGKFTIDGLSRISYFQAEISAPGYLKRKIPVRVPQGKSVFEQTFEIGKGGAITGTVVDKGTRKPVADVTIVNWGSSSNSFERQQGLPASSYTTSDDGTFTLAPAPEGENFLMLRPPAPYASMTKKVPVTNEEITEAGEIEITRGGAIFGTVTRSGTGEAMADVTVNVSGYSEGIAERKSATTGAGGGYRVEDLPAQHYSIKLNNYSTGKSIELAAGSEERVDLKAGGVKVHGKITRGGAPVDASISARKDDENASVGSTGGNYELTGLSPGEWKFSIYPQNSGTNITRAMEKTVVIPDTEDFEHDFTFPDMRITGIVVDQKGDPVAGVYVAMSREAPSNQSHDSGSNSTDQSGRFTFQGMEEGVYTITARKEEMGTAKQSGIQVKDGAPVDLRLELDGSAGGTLVSVALDYSDGSPLQEARLYLSGPDGSINHNSQRDAAGVMRITDIPPGEYRVIVSADGYSQASKNVTIKAEETATVEDVLHPAGILEWELHSTDGKHPSIFVEITPVDTSMQENSRNQGNNMGVFRIPGLAPGQYKGVATINGTPVANEIFDVRAGQRAHKRTMITIPPKTPAAGNPSTQPTVTITTD